MADACALASLSCTAYPAPLHGLSMCPVDPSVPAFNQKVSDTLIDAQLEGAPKIEFVQGEIATISLKPGDRLVLMFQVQLSPQYRERLAEVLKVWTPDIPCLVLDGGARIGVIRTSDNGERG